jgi:hypothetical protein
MLDDRATTSPYWIDSDDRRTGKPISGHETTADELRDLMTGPAGRSVPAATSADRTEPAPAPGGRADLHRAVLTVRSPGRLQVGPNGMDRSQADRLTYTGSGRLRGRDGVRRSAPNRKRSAAHAPNHRTTVPAPENFGKNAIFSSARGQRTCDKKIHFPPIGAFQFLQTWYIMYIGGEKKAGGYRGFWGPWSACCMQTSTSAGTVGSS